MHNFSANKEMCSTRMYNDILSSFPTNDYVCKTNIDEIDPTLEQKQLRLDEMYVVIAYI